MSATLQNRIVVSLLLLWLFLLQPPADCSESESQEGSFEWQILTAGNFTSQIHLHPHVLLFVTLPWSGESRSLMKELSHQLCNDQHKLDSLKLMLMHSNRDQAIADSLGASDGLTTILFFYHSVSYKYHGRLRAQDILSSANYLLSRVPEELPLKKLDTVQDLDIFLASTDKAVALFESCGWTSKFLSQHNDSGVAHGGLFPVQFGEESNRTMSPGSQTNLKQDTGNENLNCGVDKGFNGYPWVGEFTSKNNTAHCLDIDDTRPSSESLCSSEEYLKFGSFFSKFMNSARNLFLPPQRQRYGFVYERLLLSSLGVQDPGPWALVVHYAGCPNCLKVLKEANDIQDALETDYSPFMKLEGGQDFESALPVNKPSIILFVDRSSSSAETRKKSEEALDAFKDVALQFQNYVKINENGSHWPKKSVVSASQVLTSRSGDQRLTFKDKMSIIIVNEEKHVTLDSISPGLRSGSVQEILSHLLDKKTQAKLSSIAKEAGFELISDDMDIKLAHASSSQLDRHNTLALSQPSPESYTEGAYETKQGQNSASLSLSTPSELAEHYDVGRLVEFEGEQAPQEVASQHSVSDLNHLPDDHEPSFVKKLDSNEHGHVKPDEVMKQSRSFQGSTVSFFSADGDYKLLRSLTGQSDIPAMVIVDPISQRHYVFPELRNVSSFLISDFINQFHNGVLLPYQRSGPLQTLRESPPPPFVNLEFHEKDSIPCVTTNTFSGLVLGSSHPDGQNSSDAWNTDVLVLFSNQWCGFCQRMELVIREVYRFIKGYTKMIRHGPGKHNLVDGYDNTRDKLPAIYRIDCTLNDCSEILKSLGQRELYPTLLLFPAERKNAVCYEGDMIVGEIINFIASHGSSSHHLMKQRGILWIETEGMSTHEEAVEESLDAKDKSNAASLKKIDWQTLVRHNQLGSQISKGLRAVQQNVVVGSFLVASDKLSALNAFNHAKILVVNADKRAGFQGLIVNRAISWDAVPKLKEFDLLKESPLSFGGPVIHHEMPLVALTNKYVRDQYPEVGPGVYFVDQTATIQEILELKAGNRSAADYWFFLGYSGWGWNQLLDEIAEGAWTVVDGNEQDIDWPRK